MRFRMVNRKSLLLLAVVISLMSTMALPVPYLGSKTGTNGVALANPLFQMGRKATLDVPMRTEGVAKGPDGRYYVAVPDFSAAPGNGKIKVISGDPFAGTAMVSDFATGLNRPLGIVFVGSDLFVVDVNMVWKINSSGEKSVFLAPAAFPGGTPAVGIPGGALFLNGITASADGTLYIADTTRSVIWRSMRRQDGTIGAQLFLNNGIVSPLTGPNNVLFDAKGDISGIRGGLLVTDTFAQNLVVVAPDASAAPVIAPRLGTLDGMTFDAQGNLYVSDLVDFSRVRVGRVLRIKPDRTVEVFAAGLTTPSDIWVDADKGWLIVPSITTSTMTFIELK